MNALIEKLTTAWDTLSERDQKTLLFAAPVVLVLILYLLVFQPILTRYAEARAYKEELAGSLIWLYENAALVERVQNSCARQRLVEPGNDDLVTFAKNISRRSGITVDVRPSNANDLVVNLKNAQGNRAVALIQSYACHGFVVDDLELTRRSEAASDVDVNFKLSPANILLPANAFGAG